MNYPMNYPMNAPSGALGMSSFPGNLNSMNSMQSMMGPSDLSGGNFNSSFFTDSIFQTAEAHFYDGDNKLRLFNRHNGIDVNSVSGSNWLYEEYRYDALGRRIWRRTQGGQAGAYVSRTVWDGDQYLYETISNSNIMPGIEYDSAEVGYVNADGLDAPVGVWRNGVGTMTPHVDWRGAYALGTWDDGSANPCTGSVPKCSYIAWPAVGMSAARGHPLDVTLPSGYWMGSLLSEATDGSGMQYKRNRYYNPASGRFTQVDPIGLAGGLNAYGFGGGDQVNYSAPFGLCPVTEQDPTPCTVHLNGATLSNVGFRADLEKFAQLIDHDIELNGPLSGDRTAADVAELRTSKRSPHLDGIAADFHVVGMGNLELAHKAADSKLFSGVELSLGITGRKNGLDPI